VEVIAFELFYDYNCPFVYRSAEMLDAVRASNERELNVTWRYFSLSQVNSRQEGWTAWNADESESVPGRLAFRAAEAARRQGRFDPFHMALLRARHRDRLDIEDPNVIDGVAAASGLDADEFRRDIADPASLMALARDHQEARTRHGVFGTPTFVFPDGAAAYVRLGQRPMNGQAVRILDEIVGIAAGEPDILEIKRPVRPQQ
jgi:predicted DsbA family dithiol-disulfide isomerase